MGKPIKYLKTYRPFLEELSRVQREKESADAEGNEMLSRLFELDIIRIRERLKITPCNICYYSRITITPKNCEFWSKCRSFVKLENFWEEEEWVVGEYSLVFSLTDFDEN